jgi:hypothetical protein
VSNESEVGGLLRRHEAFWRIEEVDRAKSASSRPPIIASCTCTVGKHGGECW